MGTYIYKTRSSERITCATNFIGSKLFDGSKIGFLESAIDSLPIYDPANPSTYQFVNFNTGTQQKQIEFASTFTTLTFRNNYRVPVRVRVYLCIPREDTSLTPEQAMTNGLVDVGSGLNVNTPMITPYDAPQFNDLWKVAKMKKVVLQPSSTSSISNVVGSFMFDPSFVDSHNLDYQGRYGSHAYLIRVEGVVAHDSVQTSEQGNAGAGVDVQRMTKYVIKYEAGADIKWIEVVDGNDSFSNAATVTTIENENQQFDI